MRHYNDIERSDFIAAGVWVEDVVIRDSGAHIQESLVALEKQLEAGEGGLSEPRKKAIRGILRNGKYRPSGRGKPAQEFLAGIWGKTGRLDLINNAVDVNNIISLKYGVPISAFDGDKLTGDISIRLGTLEERYIFNASGQILECCDLIVVCDDSGPVGSPVKDSQRTKIFAGATRVLFVVYGSLETLSTSELEVIAGEAGTMLIEDVGRGSAGEPFIFEKRG